MKKLFGKKALSVFLAFVVAMVFAASSTISVFAADKTKTVWVLTESSSKTTGLGDDRTWKDTYKYDKNGLLIEKNLDGERTVYKRNSKGAPVSDKQYEGKKLTGTCKYKLNKKGYVVKETNYDKAKKVDSTYTATYWSNGNLKKAVYNDKSSEMVITENYRKNGTLKSDESTWKGFVDSSKAKYDKHGNKIKNTTVFEDGTKSETTYKLTYNKKGDVVKSVETDKSTLDGEETISKTTVTYKYTYDKAGNPTKVVEKSSDGEDSWTTVTTYKYKKFKVAKKYWKYLLQEIL
ncbi:MAG: hypothetical protein IJJ06_10480 [Mogibacterium sp.]|nr:hypothetical protein [Mogibacterium sp.]